MKISDAAKYLGVSKDTLRRWEKVGKVRSTRTPSNYRIYNVSHLDTVLEGKTLSASPPTLSHLMDFTQLGDLEVQTSIRTTLSSRKSRILSLFDHSISRVATGVILSITIAGALLGAKHFSISSSSNAQPLASRLGQVLAASEPTKNFLELNTDTNIKGNLTINGDTVVTGKILGATNIVNSIIAGDNVTVGGSSNNPSISVLLPPQVYLNNIVGPATLKAGTDISIASSSATLTLSDSSTLDTVAGRGGSTGNALTLSSASNAFTGTIGVSTPLSGAFTTLSSTGTFTLQSSSHLLSGTGAPSNSTGSNGDYYFRTDSTASTALYVKVSGSWTTAGSGTSGTANTIAKFNSAGTSLTDSSLTDTGSVLSSSDVVSFSGNSSSSTPSFKLTGTTFTGGTATTTKPQLLIEPSGTVSTGWSTSGTGLGVNLASGFAGRLIDLQVNGSTIFNVDSSGNLVLSGNVTGSSGGSIGYWSRSGTTLSTATAGDSLSVTGTYNTNTFTSTALTFGSTSANAVISTQSGRTIQLTNGGGVGNSVLLGGGSGSNGCTLNTDNGNLTCAGSITGGSTGNQGFWNRSGTTLSPFNAGDSITTSGNISTSGTGTITSGGALTASNGLTLSTGALSLTSSSGTEALTLTSSTTAFNVQSGLFDIDTLNSRIGILTTAPSATLTFGEGAARTINVLTRTSNAAGNSLSILAGAAGAGASAFAGGDLTLNGGAAGGTGNANGGNAYLYGGTGVGTGTAGNTFLAVTSGNAARGNVSVGSTTATSLFNVGSSAQFQVSSTGLISTTPSANSNALTITGSSITSSNLINLDSRNTSGTLVNTAFGASSTLTGALTGYKLDLSTNVTNSSQAVTGISLTNPTATVFKGIDIGTISDITSATAINIGNISATTAPNTGTGSDGSLSVASGSTNLNTGGNGSHSCSDGGTTVDAPAYSSTANTAAGSSSIVLSTTPSAGCLAANDEVLIINLQGTAGDNANVGKYETKIISSVSGATLNFSTTLTNGYDGTTQKIMVQRVPQYTSVTISSGATLTATAFDGTKFGVLLFRATGTVTVTGTITMIGNGYSGGASGIPGAAGSSIQGTGGGASGGSGSNAAGGNGANTSDGAGGGGAGGCATNGGAGGLSNNSSSVLRLGGGGGGGQCSGGGGGGVGGGVVYLAANSISVTGSISGNGSVGGNGAANTGGGGGGGGGVILLQGNTLTLGINLVTATSGGGGTGGATSGGNGGAGANGQILTNKTPNSGTTSPANTIQSSQAINNIAIQTGTLSGGGTTNYQISTGTVTAISSSTSFQENLGAVTGAASATFGSIQTGAISGAGTTSYGINLGANTSTATTNYGINIGAISGAGTTNFGVDIGNVSGSTTNYALRTNGGLIKNNSISSVILSNAALSTTATDGFVYIPTSAGAPTGVPTTQTGTVALEYDTTNNKLMIYNAAWKGGTNPGAFTDFAEWAPAAGAEIGDVVTLTDQPNNFTKDESAPFMLAKTSTTYDSKLIGVVSKYAEESNQANGYKRSPDYHAIALAGRVPTKVSTINGPIHRGDYLTSSNIPGVAMRATHPGQVLGKATEDYNSSDLNAVGQIIAFIQPGFADPINTLYNLTLDTDGTLIVPKTKATSLLLAVPTNTPTFTSDLTQVGTTTSSDQPPATNYIDLASKLQSIDSQEASTSATVAGISAAISSQSGQIASTSAQLAQQSDLLSSITAKINDLIIGSSPSAQLNLTSPQTLIASTSAQLADLSTTNLQVSQTLKSLGDTFLGKTIVAGDFSVDGTLSLTGSSLNALPTLFIQNNPLTKLVDFFNGLVKIDNKGTLVVQKLSVEGASIGSGVIPQGETHVTINTDIADTDKLFISPATITNLPLAGGNIKPGLSFDVSLPSNAPQDIKFNWWIVGGK